MTSATQEKKAVRIGSYLITGKIGQGGIAEIFRARQESLNRDVAIKILMPNLTGDSDIVRRFEQESLVIARLSHPNIVHVIDRGTAGNRYYFVMEYVDGTSLREIIDSERVPLKTKIEMIVQVCKALDYAHKNGVIHRDIKPTNVLVDREGNAHVADFGIAQILGPADREMTSSEVVMGTMAYMSPEQKISSTNVDQTTDIYAVGIMLYEILTGRKPDGHFKLPSELNSANDRDYDDIVVKCLQQEPKERFQTAVELKDALLQVIGGGTGNENGMNGVGTASFLGKCRHFDTLKETEFGSTILVENKDNKRLFVIKRLKRSEAGRKEAKLLSSLKHRNIINYIGSGGDTGSAVIVSDYARGGSLADRMVRKYDWRKAMDIIAQVALGLDFAHKNNIIHGNLRPSNVLFDADEVVKLADFGTPIHYDASKKKNWYRPPERKTSVRGDIYAMGVILHQMLTGCNPEYDAGDNLRIGELKQVLPEDVAVILRKLLAIRVGNRYQACQEIVADWDDFKQRQEASRKKQLVKADKPAAKNKAPNPLLYAGLGISIVILVIVILYLAGYLS